MALIDLKTDLKSLKFGKDRPSGGSSSQPYITKQIPDGSVTDPGILRQGGVLERTLDDVSRLTQYFFDPKSPSGVLFTAKQNVLSRTSVRTQGSGLLNDFAYAPTSTIAQAGVVGFGGHLNKQGINPFLGVGNPFTPNRYLEKVTESESDTDFYLANRLISLMDTKILGYTNLISIHNKQGNLDISENEDEVLRYGGGPGSTLGVGRTKIAFAQGNRGGSLRTGILNQTINAGTANQFGAEDGFVLRLDPSKDLPFALGITARYGTLPTFGTRGLINPLDPNGTNVNIAAQTAYQQGSVLVTNKDLMLTDNVYTSTQELLQGAVSYRTEGKVTDFRKAIRAEFKNIPQDSMAATIAPDYSGPGVSKRLEDRVLLGDPGRKDRQFASYTGGNGVLDRINALELYRSQYVTPKQELKEDFVKFRIAAIDSDKPDFKVFMHFRAFLDSFNDSYQATWGNTKYIGRGEDFYNYQGFGRTINLSWTVAAQSKDELIPMYKKLNYLASNLAPDYSTAGYMRGPLVQLTVGGYLYEQPGFITSLTYDIPQESTWELGLNDVGDYDPSVKELPHMIKVTSFQFTPIHEFVPRKNPLQFGDKKENENNSNAPVGNHPEWVKHGNSRFIALSNVGHAIVGAEGFETTQKLEPQTIDGVTKQTIRYFSNYNSVATREETVEIINKQQNTLTTQSGPSVTGAGPGPAEGGTAVDLAALAAKNKANPNASSTPPATPTNAKKPTPKSKSTAKPAAAKKTEPAKKTTPPKTTTTQGPTTVKANQVQATKPAVTTKSTAPAPPKFK
jgi:hypothetical protein